MFSRTSLNSLLKVSPTCQGKENWNLLSRGMHMLRYFRISRDMHLLRGAHMPRQTVGHALPEDDARWLLFSNLPFLPTAFVIRLFISTGKQQTN